MSHRLCDVSLGKNNVDFPGETRTNKLYQNFWFPRVFYTKDIDFMFNLNSEAV
jgi:hypothetical protein